MTVLIHEREPLVAALRERGVDYLAPSDARREHPVDDETLISSVAAHPDPRLRQALIALFLLRPQLAPLVPDLRRKLEAQAARALVAFYTAATYLQRMWSIRLGDYLGAYAELPDFFSAELGLPAAGEGHGKPGLHALAEWQAQGSPFRFNHLSEYEGVAGLVLQSLRLQRNPREPAPKR